MFVLLASLAAATTEDAGQQLKRADIIKIRDPAEFSAIISRLNAQSSDLTAYQRDYLHYLQGWRSGFDGDDAAARSRLEKLIAETSDPTLRFRAHATLANILTIAGKYDTAFGEFSRVLELLPTVKDGDVREQALLNVAELYTQVGQYDLALKYTRTLIDENWAGRGLCRGGQQQLHALYESHQLKPDSPQLRSVIDSCVALGEIGYANESRTYFAKLLVTAGRYDEAISLLDQYYGEANRLGYARLIALFDSILALAYQRKGDAARAAELARDAIRRSHKNEYRDSVVNSYRVLYQLAKEQGDFQSALAFHEKYSEVSKGYIDDVSARQLAYQKVYHENIANRLQVQALNEQNRVLQLEKQLSAKAVETSRLYIAILIMVVIFVGLWAYRTKRSQLHFMSLSQLDGLTGICNRPYFIEQAEKALGYTEKVHQEACMILCDLDHFKAINDKHGHATGDFVLRRTVAACKTHLRKSDIFGRFGGEEFAILLPGCGSEEARQRAEQLRATIAAITVQQGTGKFTVSASFGIAATSASGYQMRELLAHADAALYEAKRSGRNRVVLYDSTSGAVASEGPAAGDPVTRPFRTHTPN